MCKSCAKAQKLLDKNLPKDLAGAFLMNYTGYPFWSGENTLKEVELFLELSKKERNKHLEKVGSEDDHLPLYKKPKP